MLVLPLTSLPRGNTALATSPSFNPRLLSLPPLRPLHLSQFPLPMASDPSPEDADAGHVPDEDVASSSSSYSSSSSSSSSLLFRSDDSRSSSSSGEIPAAPLLGGLLPAAPPLEGWRATIPPGGDVPEPAATRRRCVGSSRGEAVAWGAASTVGRRKEMEDAVAVVPEFLDSTCEGVGGCLASGSAGRSHVRFFGVYDGHGGSQVANYCAQRIHEVVADEWQRGYGGGGWQRRWEVAFSDGFQRVDNEVVLEAVAPEIVGSTAVAVVVSGCQIIASNCGDSRAILCRGNQTIQLTADHKPDREDELARIEAGEGRVVNWEGPRVLGILAMSRSIGDRYLRPWVIPVPEISFTARSEEDECLILASDGLWDVMSNEEVSEVARRLLRHQRRNGVVDVESLPPAQVVANHLAKLAFQRNSSDNITVIVVDLKSRNRRHV